MLTYCAHIRQHPEDSFNKAYHDREYGFPLQEDAALLERLVLEINQAGLSWNTILRKKDNFHSAYDGFNVDTLAAYGEADVARLLADAGIIRNRLKIAAAVSNARAFLAVRREFGTFDRYLWGFVEGKPIDHGLKTFAEMPAKDELSDKISLDLKRRGFKFLGSTVVYANLQAVGMVNDHLTHCFRRKELKAKRG
jgi:DNA-3-methyladenine glycosylase I